MQATCKLSVVLCTYNEGKGIITALRSLYKNVIYSQTEVIVVDDCSTDKTTIQILNLLKKFTRFKVIRSEKNLGLSNSRNLGFKNATTKYILPLDADDTFPDDTLDIIYKTFINNSDADFIAGNYYLNEADNPRLISSINIATDGWVDKEKLLVNWMLLGTSPCKKTLWEKVNGYSLKYSYSVQDVDFWIRALQYGARGIYLDKPIYTWNKAVTGMNENFDRLDMIKLLDDHRDFYLLASTAKQLNNKVFEGYYPYKQNQVLNPFIKKYFLQLNILNRVRSVYFLVTSLFKNEA